MGLDRLDKLQQEYPVTIETRAFFLRPDIPPGGRERPPRPGEGPGGELNEPLRTYAREAGFVMRRSSHTPYTVPALEATEFAREMGAEMPFHHACFRALWERGEDIEKTEVLAAVAGEVGLDPRGLEEALRKRTYADTVQESYRQAIGYGINGIPAFVVGRYLFTGAHPYDFFQQVMERVLSEGVNPG